MTDLNDDMLAGFIYGGLESEEDSDWDNETEEEPDGAAGEEEGEE